MLCLEVLVRNRSRLCRWTNHKLGETGWFLYDQGFEYSLSSIFVERDCARMEKVSQRTIRAVIQTRDANTLMTTQSKLRIRARKSIFCKQTVLGGFVAIALLSTDCDDSESGFVELWGLVGCKLYCSTGGTTYGRKII